MFTIFVSLLLFGVVTCQQPTPSDVWLSCYSYSTSCTYNAYIYGNQSMVIHFPSWTPYNYRAANLTFAIADSYSYGYMYVNNSAYYSTSYYYASYSTNYITPSSSLVVKFTLNSRSSTGIFSLFLSNPTSSPTATAMPPVTITRRPPRPTSASVLSPLSIVGIVMGSISGVCVPLIILTVYCCVRRQQRMHQHRKEAGHELTQYQPLSQQQQQLQPQQRQQQQQHQVPPQFSAFPMQAQPPPQFFQPHPMQQTVQHPSYVLPYHPMQPQSMMMTPHQQAGFQPIHVSNSNMTNPPSFIPMMQQPALYPQQFQPQQNQQNQQQNQQPHQQQ